MSSISEFVRDISLCAIILSIILFILPGSSIGKTVKRTIIFIFIVFIITGISRTEIDIDEFDSLSTPTQMAEYIGESTEKAVIAQLSAIFVSRGIEYSNIAVDWYVDSNNKVNVTQISVQSNYDPTEIKYIIKKNYNIDGAVYGEN